MKKITILMTGLLLGGLTSHYATRAYIVLDVGLSHTYRCDQLDREANARAAAEALLEGFANAEDAPDLEAAIKEAGLRVEVLDKGGDHSIVQALPARYGSGLDFIRTASGQIDLEPCRVRPPDALKISPPASPTQTRPNNPPPQRNRSRPDHRAPDRPNTCQRQ